MTRSVSLIAALVAFVLSSLVAGPVWAAHHEPVVNVVAVTVQDGKLDAYRAQVKKLVGVLKRLGSSATVRMWNTTVGGPDSGTILVAVEYPNSAAWAADSAKVQADAEWQSIVAGLSGLRTRESSGMWRDISPNPASPGKPGSGSLLAITGVTVGAGRLEEYRQRVGSTQAIRDRLGLNGQVRVWRAEVAGPETGAVAVGIEYPDLATYVAEQDKLAADAEWRKFLADLDAIRTLNGRWLYQEITP